MSAPRIALAGAGSAVGAALAPTLARLGRLRLGTRSPQRLAGAPDGTAVRLDLNLPDTLDRLCAGCQVVVNAVGGLAPGRHGIALAARRAGADYVDAGGDAALRDLLAGRERDDDTGVAILGAGVMPGLSGLIPRWLAGQGLAGPLALTGYVATLDRMTAGSAAEFLTSLVDGSGTPYAAWRHGARTTGCPPLPPGTLPFFEGEVVGYPFLSTETEALARAVPLDEVRWYHVFPARSRVLPALGRLAGRLRDGDAATTLAAQLTRAADLDLFGRTPVQQLVFQLDGRTPAGPASRVAVLRSTGTYALTATVIALAVEQVLRSAPPPGVHDAAAVLDPGLVARLPGRSGVAGLWLLSGPLSGYADLDEGEI